MSKPEWSEKKVLESWEAFWATIERTEKLFDPRKHQTKPLRMVFKASLGAPIVFDVKTLKNVVESLMVNPHIADNFAQKTVEDKVVERTIQKWTPTACFSEKAARTLISELLNAQPEEMIVYMPVYGISIPAGRRLSVGPFTFLARDVFDSLAFPNGNIRKGQPIVSVSVFACDPNKASEKAIENYQWLENAARLFIDFEMTDFGITSFDYSHVENSIVAQPNGRLKRASSQLKGAPRLIPIMDLFGTGSFLRQVVSTFGGSACNLSEYQKRIKHAIYLGGLAVHENVASVSCFLGVSALEALFQAETDKYVSPSIAQQIVESFCFLMVDDEHRRATFEEMRSFYGKRSAIAHGGSKEITDRDARLVRNYLRHAIGKLLTDPNLSKIHNVKDIAEMIKDRKFGKK